MARNDLVKREFSRALKELASEKPVTQVSVSEIAARAGLGRSTFYYHFLDIFDLINWTAEQDIFIPLQTFIRDRDFRWSGITRHCLQVMYDNKDFYCQAIRMEGPNSLEVYFRQRNLDSWQLMMSKYLSYTGADYDAEDLAFMVNFTSQAIVNMTVLWAKEGMKIPVDTMAKMDDVATYGMYGTIERACHITSSEGSPLTSCPR